MRIVFLGLPLAALTLERAGHSVVLAGLCREGAPGSRRLRAKLGDRVVVKPALDEAFVSRARALAPDLVVSWFWTTLIPDALVGCATLGAFGVHPSLLPRWRGPDPCFWALDRGDPEVGVSAHRLAADYDTGAILGVTAMPIDPAWDAWALARSLDAPSLALMVATVDAFAAGNVHERPQDEAAVTYAPTPSEEELELDFDQPAEALVRRVRAAAPYPGAWTFLGDEPVAITRAELAPDVPRVLEPSEAAIVRGRVVVRAADTGLALLRGRSIGQGGERWCDAAELVELLGR